MDIVVLPDRQKVRDVIRSNRAGAWVSIHRMAARQQAVDPDVQEVGEARIGLPSVAIETALLSARVILR